MYTKIFNLIDEKIKSNPDKNLIIAIDGPSSSGKSYLSDLLLKKYDCNIFHMDDFFLPLERKTKERLEIAGGNVDHERFLSEVLIPLSESKEFIFDKFSCQTGEKEKSDLTKVKKLNFVEGVYSHHKNLNNHYDLKIFLDVKRENQLDRILKRSNEFMLNRFKNEWIPLEDLYFNECKVRENADLLFDTTTLF